MLFECAHAGELFRLRKEQELTAEMLCVTHGKEGAFLATFQNVSVIEIWWPFMLVYLGCGGCFLGRF